MTLGHCACTIRRPVAGAIWSEGVSVRGGSWQPKPGSQSLWGAGWHFSKRGPVFERLVIPALTAAELALLAPSAREP